MSILFGLFSRKPQSLEQAEPEPQAQPDNGQDTASLQELPPPSPSPSLVSDPSALYSLIRSVPPQVFHAYSLDRLEPSIPEPPSPTTLTKVTSFFSTLVPPPKLHCVRCHKSYFEVENTDRSCLVHHDDDSAEVERISLSRAKDLGLSSEYETLWGCCGRTVEGDGDMGPPDGWCYEGKHTTDLKRARFRADSTPNNDKLISCTRLRCPGTLLSPAPSSVAHIVRAPRKRARTGEGTDAEDPVSQTDAENEKSVRKRRRTKSATSRRKSEGDAAPTGTKEKEDQKMDVDVPVPTPKPRQMRKPRTSTTDGNDSSSSSPPFIKHRVTPRSARQRPSSEKPVSTIDSSLTLTNADFRSLKSTRSNNSIKEHKPTSSIGSRSSLKSSPSGVPVTSSPYVQLVKRSRTRISQRQKTVVDTDKEDSSPSGVPVTSFSPYIQLVKRSRPRISHPQKTVVDTDKEDDLDSCPRAQPQTQVPGARTRARAKALAEVVETSVDAERV